MATKKAGTSGRSTSATRSRPTKSSAAEKSATKKTATKKSPAKRTTGKEAVAAEDGTAAQSSGSARRSAPRRSAPRASAPKRKSGMAIAAGAAQQLLELTGRDVEGVTGFERDDDGWRVEVEAVEVRRIPDTTDVLALYEVKLDADGEIEGYRRLRRYVRGTPGQES